MIRSALPGVTLEVRADLLTPGQVERLLDGRLDLGVLRGPVAEPGIETRSLLQEPLVLALPADHRLVPEAALEVADVAADEFVAYADTRSAVNEAMVSSLPARRLLPQHHPPRPRHRRPAGPGGRGPRRRHWSPSRCAACRPRAWCSATSRTPRASTCPWPGAPTSRPRWCPAPSTCSTARASPPPHPSPRA
ncbi:LysR substrate-binding domain-containing protein [Nocardioides convexus]|uniref:LysR substrate-binding domain-containing protein n=1 Tax=Nocardioides convexus TaxID=2712224 RepID=UPI003100FF6C